MFMSAGHRGPESDPLAFSEARNGCRNRRLPEAKLDQLLEHHRVANKICCLQSGLLRRILFFQAWFKRPFSFGWPFIRVSPAHPVI